MQTSQSIQRLEARVTGRVQGVGFRHFAIQQAQRLGLSGWVRNERDGSVSLVAEGSIGELRALLNALGTGPRAARVQNVLVDWEAATGEFDGFSVRF